MIKVHPMVQIKQAWSDCTDCDLHRTRNKVVFHRGSLESPLVAIGEAPGADEDRDGKPFVGRSGKLLDEVLLELGIDPKDVLVMNVIGCRPPNNRNPTAPEIAACSDRLASMLIATRPKVLLVLGGVASRRLVSRGKVSKVRGEIREAQLIFERRLLLFPALVTYHPSYVLRDHNARDDFKKDIHTAATLAGLLEAA